MIRSAVRTTLHSLRSDLVAELNQTGIEVQRTDSMMAELFQQHDDKQDKCTLSTF